MIERSHIEQLLRVNGVPVSSPDHVIIAVLTDAKWHEQDVKNALQILRDNAAQPEVYVDTIQKVFQTDDKLKPESISALLGIDMVVPKIDIKSKSFHKKHGMSKGQILQIFLVSICFALLFVFGSMLYLHMGVFHITYALNK